MLSEFSTDCSLTYIGLLRSRLSSLLLSLQRLQRIVVASDFFYCIQRSVRNNALVTAHECSALSEAIIRFTRTAYANKLTERQRRNWRWI